MKKLFIITYSLFIILAMMPICMNAQERVMVIADPHVIEESVLKSESNYEEYMAKQRKMLDLSESIWNALVDTALKYKPALVLIPGDLTRDGEASAHTLVSNSLKELQKAGIRSLVIPGNHDIPDANWETLYPDSYLNAIKDPNGSHSYTVEPLDGVTVIGIDGSKGNAGQGELSDATFSWILEQADAAVVKGNMIIAMCHWQLLEHFDQQSTLESSCRLKNADDIRNQLMHHGVHLVLTGHFHVNGITTFRDTTGVTNDSIVEITTGSPITYPCPYRWLTFSKNRASVSVETENITAVGSITDLNTYSREWMKEHTKNMIPSLALKAWGKIDNRWDSDVAPALQDLGFGNGTIKALKAMLPSTDEERIALVQKHLGEPAVNLYLFHSEANENEHPEKAKELAQAVYDGMEGMMKEVISISSLAVVFAAYARVYVEEPVQSLVGDTTHLKSKKYNDQTDDLHLTLTINKPRQITGIEDQMVNSQMTNDQLYDVMGRPVMQPVKGQLYIRNRKKILY